MSRRFPRTLWVILAVAAGLRLLGAWIGNLNYDESMIIARAEAIDLRPGNLRLVWQTVNHPLLTVYVVKISGYLFGNSDFGLRILHVLLGTANVFLIFLLGKKVCSVRAGLWAAALLAVDRFHHTWSYAFEPELLLVFFATLALLLYLRATETQTYGDFAMLGTALGLAYLSKETAILLFPILWLHTLANPERRASLFQGKWLMMHAVAAVVISSDLVWNATHFYEGYFYRDIDLLTRTLAISPRAIWLYLGEFSVDLQGWNPSWCHWPAGALYLVTATLAFVSRRRKRLRLLSWVFWAVFLFFTVLPAETDRFWWASLTIIPAVVICGEYLRRWPRYVTLVFVVYLGIQATLVGLQPGSESPRIKASERIESAVQLASMRADSDWKARRDLENILLHVLQIAGPDTRLHGYLAQSAHERRQPRRARYFARRALERDAQDGFGALVGRRIKQVASAVPSGLAMELEDEWAFEKEADEAGRFLPVPVSGRIDPGNSSLGRLDLAVAVNGVIEAVTQTYEGPGSSFTAMVPGTVFKAGSNQVEVFVISASSEGPRLASIPEKKKDALRYSLAQAASGAREEIIVSPAGRTIRIVPAAMEGSVDVVQRHAWLWHTFVLSGWASDGARRQPAGQVAVFVDGEADHYRHAVVSRSDLVEGFKSPPLEQAGFRVSLPAHIFKRDPPPVVRVFAVSSAGVASELEYRLEYDDGSRRRYLGQGARPIRYSLAEDAAELAGKEFIVSPSGTTVRIVSGAMDGAVDAVLQQDERTQVSGWASDGSHRRPADQVVIFVDGEADHGQHTVVSRMDVVKGFGAASLEQAGFRIVLPDYIFDRDPPRVVRVFALSPTGVASELRYLSEYLDGSRSVKLGKR